MFDDRKSRGIGAISLAVLALAAAAVVALDSLELRPGIRVNVYFAHLGQLRAGADVQVAGQVIGRIKSVRLVPERLADEAGHPLRGTGGVEVRTRIERRYVPWVPKNGEFFVSAKGLIGESYLEIGPPPADEPLGRLVENGDWIRGIDPPRLDRVMQRSFENLITSRLFLETVRPEAEELAAAVRALAATLEEVEPASGDWSELGASVFRLADEGEALAAELARGGFDAEKVRAVIERGREFFDRAGTELGEIGDRFERLRTEARRVGRGVPGQLAPKLESALRQGRSSLARLQRIAARTRALLARIERGEGTVGALLNDPEFIDDAKKLGKIIKRQPWRVVGRPPD